VRYPVCAGNTGQQAIHEFARAIDELRGGRVTMSDTPIPDARAEARIPAPVRQLARNWWLFLVLGVLWVLFGMFVLSYNVGSLLALAAFAAATFIATGVT
jgi:hypothetical protein